MAAIQVASARHVNLLGLSQQVEAKIAPRQDQPRRSITGAEHDLSAYPVPRPAFEFDQRLTG